MILKQTIPLKLFKDQRL